MGSNTGRKFSLLGFVHLVEGSPFQVQRAIGKAALIRGRFDKKKSRVVALVVILYTCIKILRFNICYIKSNVKTLEP